VSPELADLLRKMLKIDPRNRITIGDVARHPWVTKNLPRPLLFMNEMLIAARKRAQAAAAADAAADQAAAAFGADGGSGSQPGGSASHKPKGIGGSGGSRSTPIPIRGASGSKTGASRDADRLPPSAFGFGGGGNSLSRGGSGRSLSRNSSGKSLSRGSSANSSGQLPPLATAAAAAVAAAGPLSRSGGHGSTSSFGSRRPSSVPLTFFIRQSNKDLRALVHEAARGSSAADSWGSPSSGGRP
jgi:serine/threonine protein kinase